MGFLDRLFGRSAPKAVVAPANKDATAERIVAAEPTAGYRPTTPLSLFGDYNGIPPLYLFYNELPAIRICPHADIAMSYYRSGTQDAEFEIRAKDPTVARFVNEQLQRLWQTSLPQIQEGYETGWAGCEVKYRFDDDGMLAFDTLNSFSTQDVTLLTRKRRYFGIRIRNVGDGSGTVDLWGPDRGLAKAFWYVHRGRHGSYFGTSQLLGAWRPWRRLCGLDGGETVIDGAVYRAGYRGPTVFYPPGGKPKAAERGPQGMEGAADRDWARKIGEDAKSGMSVGLPSIYDDKGNRLWEVNWPEHVLNVDSLINYNGSLENQITLGIGVPPELIQASETGSGYSGREIPLEGYFGGQTVIANSIVRQFCEQVLLPLVRWNFGPDATFDAAVVPLLKTRQKRTAEANAPPPSPFGPPMRMATTPGAAPFDPSKHPRGQGGKFASVHGKGEIDEFVRSGERELFRGVTHADHAEQFKTGDLRAGRGTYGNGIYAAYGSAGNQAVNEYAGDDGVAHRMTLRADAKVIQWDDAETQFEQFLAKLPGNERAQWSIDGRAGGQEYGDKSIGDWARAQGYDAIDIPHNNYVNVLNPAAVRVQRERHYEGANVEPENPRPKRTAPATPLEKALAPSKSFDEEMDSLFLATAPAVAVDDRSKLPDPRAEAAVATALRLLAPHAAKLVRQLLWIALHAPASERMDRAAKLLRIHRDTVAIAMGQASLAGALAAWRRVVDRLPGNHTPSVGPPAPPPPNLPTLFSPDGRPPKVRLTLIDEAVADLQGRRILTQPAFYAMADEARDGAFTVAGVTEASTLERIRALLAQNVQQGASKRAWSKAIRETLDADPFLSPAHQGNVFRTNVHAAYSKGMDRILDLPLVGSFFPYEAIDPILDNRVRDSHAIVATSGLNGTNVYRRDDPVMAMIRPPSDYNCRCGRNPLSINMAAARGVREAIKWKETGQAPMQPEWVPTPPGWPTDSGYRRMATRRLATKADKGRWITIGGSKGEGGKRSGGSPVFIVNGRIEKGHPSLTGKKLSNLKDDAPAESHRKELNRSKDHAKAKWAKKAKESGHKPEDIHSLAKQIRDHDKALVADRVEMLKSARKYSSVLGSDIRGLRTKAGKGGDAASVRHLDDVAASMVAQYPEQFAGADDPLDRLYELLAEGNPEPMSEDDAYSQALDQLDQYKAESGDGYGDDWERGEADDSGFAGDVDFDFGGDEPPAPAAPHEADHVPAIKAIAPGSTDYVAGHPVIRKADGTVHLETDKYHVQGEQAVAERIQRHWKDQLPDRKRIDAALARSEAYSEPHPFMESERSDADTKARNSLKPGTRAVSLDPETRGRIGTVVRDDNGNVGIRLDGTPNAKVADFEPLDEGDSWRSDKPKAAKPAPAVTPPLFMATAADLAAKLAVAAEQVDGNPSDAQKEAGNYAKGHLSWNSLPITIETAKGQTRSGVGKDGPWSITMQDHYGYIKRTESEADGDHLDVFISEDYPDSHVVFVVNQMRQNGSFDEHKCILGQISRDGAKAAYLRNYADGWTGCGTIHAMTISQFRDWIANGDTSKPFEG